MTGSEIRETFLKYFEDRGHTRVVSSPLVPQNDPTLFFTNAGMVQFKDVFTGVEKRSYNKAASTQKCMRVSGKHNDLENVGRTARHHTFFEMLGNFSFGDYFKEDAIRYGWEFLTETVPLPPDNLIVTIFEDDDEAFHLWRKITGIDAERIFRLGEKDNFWAMGDTGPCGPCSEILIDQGKKLGCGTPECGPECDCGRFLELWNLVFMQFDRNQDGDLIPLPSPSIDTGMGLERLAAVLQGEVSNYHTDLVFPFLEEAARLAGVKYGSDEQSDTSLRVIADHIRAVTFLISDGVLPSNEGRGYVLRRIIRRAARHGKLLGMDGPFLYRICPLVGEKMSDAFPELTVNMSTVVKIAQLEEERFANTLEHGLRRLSDLVDQTKSEGKDILPGDEVFRLYDTYGFPLDLSEDIAEESDMSVDVDGFNTEMELQRERARASWSGSGEEDVPALYRKIAEKAGPVVFSGYDEEETSGARILAISSGDKVRKSAEGNGIVEIVLDRTPFYGESGGQAGDTGKISGDGFLAQVTETVLPLSGLTVHRCNILNGKVSVGDTCTATVDHEARSATRSNHTATHLLHTALRDVLGDHVKQSGSLVEPGRLRFDFTHFTGLTREEVGDIEDLVNIHVLENLEVSTELMPLSEALDHGAVALFGEKYGDSVRVVSVQGVSTELCGGTHVSRTGDIGLFKITQEGSIAAGVRRLEAVTGPGVVDLMRSEENVLQEMAASVKVSVSELPARLAKLLETVQEQERKIKELQRDLTGGGSDLMESVTESAGVKLLAAEVAGQDPASLRDTADRLKDKIGSGIVLLGTRDRKKVFLTCVVSKDLVERFSASDIIDRLAPMVEGGGGGRPDMAQAGGKKPEGLPGLLEKAGEVIEEIA